MMMFDSSFIFNGFAFGSKSIEIEYFAIHARLDDSTSCRTTPVGVATHLIGNRLPQGLTSFKVL